MREVAHKREKCTNRAWSGQESSLELLRYQYPEMTEFGEVGESGEKKTDRLRRCVS